MSRGATISLVVMVCEEVFRHCRRMMSQVYPETYIKVIVSGQVFALK